MPFSRAAALTLLLAASTAYAELDKKQQGLLNRIGRGIEDQKGALERMRERDFTERVKGDYEKRIAKLEAQLSELPAEDTSVAGARAELDKLKAVFGEKAGGLSAKQEAAAGREQAILALLAAPEFEAELDEGRALVLLAKTPGVLGFDGYWLSKEADSLTQRDLGAAKGFTAATARYEALVQKYAVAAEKGGPMIPGKASQVVEVQAAFGKDGQEAMAAHAAKVKAYAEKAPAVIDGDVAKLQELVSASSAPGAYDKLVRGDGDVQRLAHRCTNLLAVFAALGPEAEVKRLRQAVEKATGRLEAAIEKSSAAIVGANRAAPNAYAGADKAELEAWLATRWKKDFPKEAPLAVRFTDEAFTRKQGLEWNDGKSRWEKVDESFIRIEIIVPGGEGEAVRVPGFLYRLHMEGNKLALVHHKPSRPSPSQRMLRKNL